MISWPPVIQGATLKQSKSISGIFGWVLTSLDPKFQPISVVFQLDYTIIFMNLSHGTMGLRQNSFYNVFAMILCSNWGSLFLGLKKSKSISGILGQYWSLLFLTQISKFFWKFFDWVRVVLNLSYVTMCFPPMHLRMVLCLNLESFNKSLKKSKKV